MFLLRSLYYCDLFLQIVVPLKQFELKLQLEQERRFIIAPSLLLRPVSTKASLRNVALSKHFQLELPARAGDSLR